MGCSGSKSTDADQTLTFRHRGKPPEGSAIVPLELTGITLSRHPVLAFSFNPVIEVEIVVPSLPISDEVTRAGGVEVDLTAPAEVARRKKAAHDRATADKGNKKLTPKNRAERTERAEAKELRPRVAFHSDKFYDRPCKDMAVFGGAPGVVSFALPDLSVDRTKGSVSFPLPNLPVVNEAKVYLEVTKGMRLCFDVHAAGWPFKDAVSTEGELTLMKLNRVTADGAFE